jgi:geranylgeranyl pyrophosphate synthase
MQCGHYQANSGITMDFITQSAAYIERIEKGIERILPPADTRPCIIHEAMRYSVQAGGKRLRPTLVLAAADMGDASLDALPAAVAVECLHTYSLIHDDMPCVDNSDLRRGRATSHRRFGEAMALLAGDALLTEAFRILGTAYAGHERTGYALTGVLAQAASSTELIGGQVEDVLGEGRDISKADLDFIHLNKTAALIAASLEMGLLHAQPDEPDRVAIRKAGRAMGLAFQIIDDVLDATSDAATMGKTVGQDAARGKNTYVKYYGIAAARSRAVECTQEAVGFLDRWGSGADYLTALAEDMARRVR